MPNRHRSRELLVQFVYQWTINPCELSELAPNAESFWKRHTEEIENQHYFLNTAEGVVRSIPHIDNTIEGLLQNWKMSRLSKVDLAILRVAIYELNYEDKSHRADVAVIIDEAVEISKKYGSKDSPAFINGILDRAAAR